jgi:cytochrome c-type biogenesis protein CcsB
MAALSDQLLVVTILTYLAAMVAHAAEYAFTTRPARALAGVGARTSEPAAAKRAGLLSRLAVASLLLAATAHLTTLATRGIAADRLPWGNMYEYLLTATFVGVVAWCWVLFRYPAVRHLGLYVALVNVLLLGLAGMVAYTPAGPLVPALNSYWRVIHVAAAVAATGLFLVGFVGAVMYLIRAGYDRGSRRFPYTLARRIPAAEAVERLTFRLHAFAFPVWTFAVAAGAIWAEAAWGRYWGWDPKEVWAFITWVVYAGYLHARATPSVRRSVVAWLAILGWLTMMMNLFGVNFFFEGLHSYA